MLARYEVWIEHDGQQTEYYPQLTFATLCRRFLVNELVLTWNVILSQ